MTISKINTIILSLVISLSFAACSSDDDATDDSNSGGKDLVAAVAFESGDKIDFGHNFPNLQVAKPALIREKGSEESLLIITGSMGTYTLSITGVIEGKGEYHYIEGFDEDDREKGAMITFSIFKNSELEMFLPFKTNSETMGSVNLNITTLSENTIKGTFSATLYSSKTGEKLIIKDGKIDSGLYRTEVEP